MSATATVTMTQNGPDLDVYDEEQGWSNLSCAFAKLIPASEVRLMEERCIVVNERDEPQRDGSKKECHLMENINTGLLHRAFSVFLFRPSDGRLLLQKRADEKITFPGMWTNTCCSHPLAIKSELVEANQAGVRAAAIRKLPHELGIPPEQLKADDFTYLTRIHYLAPSDGLWGEHEIDYILFCALDVTLDINPNEVSDAKYVSKEELEAMFADSANSFTPWFRLICRDLLFPWWADMSTKSREAGWNPEKGEGRIDPRVLEAGVKPGELLKMV